MIQKTIQNITSKLKYLPKLYSNTFQPYLSHIINYSIIQPSRSLIRYHQLKKAYNTNYRYFLTFCKAFTIAYCMTNLMQYDILTNSLIGRATQKTQYMSLVQRASFDSAGAQKIQYTLKQMIEKGKQNGLLSIQLNQLSYLLQPYQITWQGKYLASLKS